MTYTHTARSQPGFEPVRTDGTTHYSDPPLLDVVGLVRALETGTDLLAQATPADRPPSTATLGIQTFRVELDHGDDESNPMRRTWRNHQHDFGLNPTRLR